ncbi:MAG: penicillin-binding protein 2 [Bdellovibrionales bacterium]|nr:penicillin-binding protein 2 [Bdellovibrionales bacterium]
MNRLGMDEERKELLPRYRLLYIVVAVSALMIVTRLWYLQILKGEELRDYSEKNRIKETKIPAQRGLILDRNGEVLVDNLPGFSVTITPQYAKDLTETADDLSPILDIPSPKIISTVKKSRSSNGLFWPAKIKENLSLDEVVRVKKLRLYHEGLDIHPIVVRHYPLGENGAQLFGYVGEISKRQISRMNNKYKGQIRFEQGDIIGKSGLEQKWESSVRGKNGIRFVEVDARGRGAKDAVNILGFNSKPAQQGNNLVLTIDKDIQKAAYEAMNRNDKIGPRIGSLVAIKANGEVLAWVNSPSFDPNRFSTGISPEFLEELRNDPFKPFRNRVIQDHYPPGSTFKPIIAIAALQEGVVKEQTIVHSPGFIMFAGRPYHDHLRGGHGDITIAQAIERSSNVFFYKMGIQLGIDKMAKYAKALGIGARTQIKLYNEAPGLMPTKEWKLKRFGEPWQPGENLSNAIGQGFVLTTPLQMAVAYNTIGLEGLRYKPFIVKKIIDSNSQVVVENKPQLIYDLSEQKENQVYISKETFKAVKKGMWGVANGPHGTARWWKIPNVEMAGKTGTVQMKSYSKDQIYDRCDAYPFQQRHHGWFVGFAPADKPEITVAILAEHSCHGSTGGAPVVRDTIKAYFEKYRPELFKASPHKVTHMKTVDSNPKESALMHPDTPPPTEELDE